MSWRHMHITSYLYGTADHIGPQLATFIDTARSLGFFRDVTPVLDHNGVTIAVAFCSKDLDDVSNEIDMPQVAQRLSGILPQDIEIVTAFEGDSAQGGRTCVWPVPGSESLAAQRARRVAEVRELDAADDEDDDPYWDAIASQARGEALGGDG